MLHNFYMFLNHRLFPLYVLKYNTLCFSTYGGKGQRSLWVQVPYINVRTLQNNLNIYSQTNVQFTYWSPLPVCTEWILLRVTLILYLKFKCWHPQCVNLKFWRPEEGRVVHPKRVVFNYVTYIAIKCVVLTVERECPPLFCLFQQRSVA
jgi:hypothetical protein